MANEEREDARDRQIGEQQERELPPGVKLLRTIEAHEDIVLSVAFDPTGQTLASGGEDKTVKLWEVPSGKLLRTLEGRENTAFHSLAFDAAGRTLASGGRDKTVKLWDVASGKLLFTLEGHKDSVHSVAFDPKGRILASGSGDEMVKLWEVTSGELLFTLEGHEASVRSVAFDAAGRTLASGGRGKTVNLWDVASGKLLLTLEGHEHIIYSVAFDAMGRTLASGGRDKTVKLWDVASSKLLRTLEGHTSSVGAVAFSADGHLLASKSNDGTLRLWSCETWETVAVITEPADPSWFSSLAFHPTLPLLATPSSKPDAAEYERCRLIHIWELDLDVLLGKAPKAKPAIQAVHHTTAKIVLVGNHSVGKSGLGWHLAHGEFKEQSSSHGQQFWVLPQLGKLRDDGTECEAILWDLAGHPDYRLIHALFLNDVDLALVLFDSSNISDPLHGVEFWLKQLQGAQKLGAQASSLPEGSDDQSKGRLEACAPRVILVGAQADRGTPTLTLEELEAFCHQRGISGYLSTSAKAGSGLEELIQRMKDLIPWEEKATTVTTVTFKRIKDYVLKLKERQEGSR